MDKKKLAIIMLGAPGSGKGTQGEILEKRTKYKKYVMSDLIKLELKPGTELYEKTFSKGILLGDEDVFEVFKKYFKVEDNVILDGIPRTENQAYWVDGFLEKHDYDIKVVYLNVDEKKLVKRIISRRYCPKCHRGYNILTKKPKVEGICDIDSEKLIQRKDDTKEVFEERLEIYDNVKKIILEIYKDNILEVNGDQDIDKVGKDILNKLNLK